MKDFLDREFEVGDLIIYPKMSGRSVCLVKGVVKKFNDSGTVTVQPEIESWNGGRDRHTTEKYIDTRTGKSFDPYHDKNEVHMERPQGYIVKATGEWISAEAKHLAINEMRSEWYAINKTPLPWSKEYDLYGYAQPVWKDYVKIESTIPTVTIKRTDNLLLAEKRV